MCYDAVEHYDTIARRISGDLQYATIWRLGDEWSGITKDRNIQLLTSLVGVDIDRNGVQKIALETWYRKAS